MSEVPKRKLTPEEVLDAIEESDADDEAERILALSDEQLDRELAEAGFDPQGVRRRGRELAGQMTKTPESRLAPAAQPEHAANAKVLAIGGPRSGEGREVARRRIDPRWVALLAAALGAAAVGVMVALPRNTPDASPAPIDAATSSGPSPRIPPGHLRDRAMGACQERLWRECLKDLDAAESLDPAGDADERVQAARKAALLGIAEESER